MARAVLLLASVAVLTGCSLCSRHRPNGAACTGDADEMPPPPVRRSAQEASMVQLTSALGPSPSMEAPLDYRALTPRLCQCLAAKHAPLADSFDSQRQQLQQQHKHAVCRRGFSANEQRAFQESILLYSALESRDRAAGTALEWYYQLVGAEAQTDLLHFSIDRAHATLEHVARLQKQGIQLPAPIEEHQSKVLELQLEQARNQLTIEQLNAKLRLALGYDLVHPWLFWPDLAAPLCLPSDATPEVESAVRLGLAQRPQLLLLRAAIANLDRDTLGPARSLLTAISPLLAMSSPKSSCKVLALLGKLLHIQPGKDDEVERVRAQLSDGLHQREREVAAEIRSAVHEMAARRQGIVLAHAASARWRTRIDDLDKKRTQGMQVFADLTEANTAWGKSRGEAVKEFVAWRIAAVKLKQAQGILPAECGYTDCANEEH